MFGVSPEFHIAQPTELEMIALKKYKQLIHTEHQYKQETSMLNTMSVHRYFLSLTIIPFERDH